MTKYTNHPPPCPPPLTIFSFSLSVWKIPCLCSPTRWQVPRCRRYCLWTGAAVHLLHTLLPTRHWSSSPRRWARSLGYRAASATRAWAAAGTFLLFLAPLFAASRRAGPWAPLVMLGAVLVRLVARSRRGARRRTGLRAMSAFSSPLSILWF